MSIQLYCSVIHKYTIEIFFYINAKYIEQFKLIQAILNRLSSKEMFLKFLLEPDLHLKEPFSRTSDKLLSFLCCVQFYQNNDSIEIVLHSIALVCYHLLICFEKKQKIVFFVISQQKKIKKIIFFLLFRLQKQKILYCWSNRKSFFSGQQHHRTSKRFNF